MYLALGSEFLLRYHRDRPVSATSNGRGFLDGDVKTMIIALAFSTLLLFIRWVASLSIAGTTLTTAWSSIYRIIELAGGWHGRVLHTEVYFNVLDGGMVVLALLSFNFAHPGRLLGSRRPAVPLDRATEQNSAERKEIG
jgi:hypothetical protein